MPDYRETLIRISYDDKTAEVWTEQAGLASRLKRLGFKEIKQQGRGVWLKGGRKQISFRKAVNSQGRKPNTASLEALRKARQARQTA